MSKITLYIIALVFTGFGLTPVHADGGDSWGGSKLAPFKELIDAEKYQQAITELGQALKDSPDNADFLNLIAFSHRKLNQYEIALDYYQKALKIDPEHRGANEYLGELYLQLGELEKAEQRLAVLDKECFFVCDEYDELKQAIEEYRKQNPS